MHARLSSRSRALSIVALALTAGGAGLVVGGCDCAGNVTPTPTTDAGDTGVLGDSGPPRDGGPDTGVRADGGPDTGMPTDGGVCTPVDELCNGADDDCDGLVDENVVAVCGSNVGICRTGTQTCTGGTLGACSGGVSAEPAEICGNGLDDDCNEMVDDGCTCQNGATQSCGSGVGECHRGTQTCAGGAWGACVGEVTPTNELCDDLDNNCDGLVDEIFPGVGGSCDGPDTDQCAEGTLACSSDHLGTTCSDTTGDAMELCNGGTDDDCDGMTDEGCTCTDGATQSCGSGVGECMAGTQTCAAGAWGPCMGSVGPTSELCDGLDNNCDGATDEGFVLGMACDGADADFCTEGTTTCDPSTGGVVCSDTTGSSAETCNAMDDDCDGASDEGFSVGMACDGTDADACNEGMIACNGTGGASCSDTTGDSVEVCNGADDDCDGNVDEGNPGGGVACAGAADHGTCVSRTACISGALVCRGTFVSATGTAGAPGSDTMPTNSITTAIANAVAIGGATLPDVCVCDPPGGAASTFTENVTMVEGVSVLGGFDCNGWNVSSTSSTVVQDTDADGLAFPAGITAATTLDRMTVVGFDDAGSGATTSAVTITDGSPALNADTVRAGRASTAIGLRVVSASGPATPAINNGSYAATGVAGGTAVAISVDAAAPRLSMVTVQPGGSGVIAMPPATSYGVRCTDCGGTTIASSTIAGGAATATAYGLYGTGNVAGLAVTNGSIAGGTTSVASSSTFGVDLATCRGAPTFTGVITNGGNNGGPPGAGITRTAFASSGASCAPVIDGGRYIGCESNTTCIGIDASASSALVVRNVGATAGGPTIPIAGAVGSADTTIGIRCVGGSCASITASVMAAGTVTRSGPTGVGLWIDGSAPTVDSCRITGPNGGLTGIAIASPVWAGVYLTRGAGATLTNDVVHDGTHAQRVFSVLYDYGASAGIRGPLIVNNTIDYQICQTCGPRVGLGILNSGTAAVASGVFRNNIVHALGPALGLTPSNAVMELNAASDPMTFENNALFDATAAMGGVYVDEGTMNLSTTIQLQALYGLASGNQVVDCGVNGTFHIGGGSACLDSGTMTSCPRADFEGTVRPQGLTCDIGCDEH